MCYTSSSTGLVKMFNYLDVSPPPWRGACVWSYLTRVQLFVRRDQVEICPCSPSYVVVEETVRTSRSWHRSGDFHVRPWQLSNSGYVVNA